MYGSGQPYANCTFNLVLEDLADLAPPSVKKEVHRSAT